MKKDNLTRRKFLCRTAVSAVSAGALTLTVSKPASATGASRKKRKPSRPSLFDKIYGCLAATAAGLAGAFSGSMTIPAEWIEAVEQGTRNNPYTNSHMTIKETAEGVYSALLIRLTLITWPIVVPIRISRVEIPVKWVNYPSIGLNLTCQYV